MKLTILAFAQSREALGFAERAVDFTPDETPREILRRIAPDVPVEGLRVALDCEFADWNEAVGEAKELALIPPVSGG